MTKSIKPIIHPQVQPDLKKHDEVEEKKECNQKPIARIKIMIGFVTGSSAERRTRNVCQRLSTGNRNPDSHGTMHTCTRSLKMVGFWSEAAVTKGVLEAGGVVTRGLRVNDHQDPCVLGSRGLITYLTLILLNFLHLYT